MLRKPVVLITVAALLVLAGSAWTVFALRRSAVPSAAPPVIPPGGGQKVASRPSGWIVFAGETNPGSNRGFLGLYDPRTGNTKQVAAPDCRFGSLTPVPAGVLLGGYLFPVYASSSSNVGQVVQPDGAAVLWQPATGAVKPWGLDFRVPRQGTIYSGMENPTAVPGRGDFALYGFHGGGVGEIFDIYTPGLQRDPVYSSISSYRPEGGGVYFEQQMTSFPPVLAGSPDGTWLLRGAVGYQSGPGYGYGLVAPGGRITMDGPLNKWHHQARAAAFGPGGWRLALLTTHGGLWVAEGSNPPVQAAQIPAPLYNPATEESAPPAAVAWPPGGRHLLAGFGPHLQLFQVTGGDASFLRQVELPTGAGSWAWIAGGTAVLPTAVEIKQSSRELTTAGAAAAVLVPAPPGTPPRVTVVRTTAAGSESMVVAGGQAGVENSLWGLIPRGDQDPSLFPAVAAATKKNWVVLPMSGWLPRGRYTVTAGWPGGSITRQIDF